VTATPDLRTPTSILSAPLAEIDPDIAGLLDNELRRERDTLEMIASENFAPRAVLQLQGSVLTNKYAEGLGPAVLRRLRARGRHREHRPRPRQGVVRR
jgi:glycine hydroxymethyltransferase